MNNAHDHMLVVRTNLLGINTKFRITYCGLCFAIELFLH
jgi:hypothetical protein